MNEWEVMAGDVLYATRGSREDAERVVEEQRDLVAKFGSPIRVVHRVTAFPLPYVFAWGNNARRAELKGRRCRVVASGALGSVLVEFENGERVSTSRRALRRG